MSTTTKIAWSLVGHFIGFVLAVLLCAWFVQQGLIGAEAGVQGYKDAVGITLGLVGAGAAWRMTQRAPESHPAVVINSADGS